jgi:hypothetical protein
MPKSQKWLMINCVVNVVGSILFGFYVFKGERLRDNYIQHYKPRTCMAMQIKTWMTSFFFKKFLSFFKDYVPNGISQTTCHLLVLDGHKSHVTLEALEQAMAFGLDMITLSLHTSRALQPLDVSCFKPFKTTFKK